MPIKTILIIIFTVSLSAVAQLVLKLGVSQDKIKVAIEHSVGKMLLAYLGSAYIWGGLLLYGLGMALWLWVLSKVDLSLAYPFVGLSFIMTMLFGTFFLHETISVPRAIGTLMIAIGCVLIARSA